MVGVILFLFALLVLLIYPAIILSSRQARMEESLESQMQKK